MFVQCNYIHISIESAYAPELFDSDQGLKKSLLGWSENKPVNPGTEQTAGLSACRTGGLGLVPIAPYQGLMCANNRSVV